MWRQGTVAARAGLPLLLAALAFALYGPALRGPFVSDDFGYLHGHPHTAELSLANAAAILDPAGDASLYTGNYAPVHLLLTALERQLFGEDPLGYHLVNVALHALCAWLLGGVLRDAGLPNVAALAASLLFLVHPANVEAVAWISQLKSTACLAFALGAWRCLERRPGAATALFALALGTKASALFLLPTAFAWLRTRAPDAGGPRARAALAAWTALAALYAIPMLRAFAHLGAVEVPAFADPSVQGRTVFAVAMRYLLMAPTSIGVAAFQETPPATSWLDPWWLGGLLACLLLGGRALWALRGRRVEGAFWVAAAAAFAPVSQLFPFLHPVADRYLYFMLPGLLGAAACAVSGRAWLAAPRGGVVAALLLGALLSVFAVRSVERARLWRGETWLLLDAARQHPEGGTAHLLRARRAARSGDADAALAHLRIAVERGFDRFDALAADPGLAPIRAHPGFRALIAELAGRWIERVARRGATTQPELHALARAHRVRGETQGARDALERALAVGGARDAAIREELRSLRER